MIMADVLKIFLIILGLMITMGGYWLLFEAVAPGPVDRARSLYQGRPWKLLLIGALAGIPSILLCVALLNGPAIAKLLGFTGIFALLLASLMGSAGLAKHVGFRLPSPGDERQPWKRVLRGAAILTITFVLPGLGWFVLLPYALLSGLGAAILAARAPHEELDSAMPAPADSFHQ